MLRTVAGRPGWRRLLVSYLLAASLRCQASSVAGVTGKTPVQRRRGMNRVSAVNQARPAGSYRTRPAFRRRTAFSCRSTSSPAFFAWSPRNIRTARPKVHRMSRQAILSSTPPANHHRIIRSGETAAQRCDRVSGRHSLPGEVTYLVPPLELPPESAGLQAISRAPAVQLFLDRASAAKAGAGADAAPAEVIARICRGLDGLPLAIELAAARQHAVGRRDRGAPGRQVRLPQAPAAGRRPAPPDAEGGDRLEL
jgi:hypothetical protein